MARENNVETAGGDSRLTPSPGNSTLRTLLGSTIVCKVADWQLNIVVPLAILRQTGSVALSLATFALRGVAYVASPLLGLLIDRFDRRTVFVAAQAEQAVCLGLLAWFPSRPLVVSVLLLLSGIGGVATSITGQFVLIPELITAEHRALAVAKMTSAIEFAKVMGLLLGGVTFSSQGPVFSSVVIACLYLVAGAIALLLPRVPPRHTMTSVRHDLGLGFRWLRRPEILWLVAVMSIVNLAVGQIEPALTTQFAHGGIDPTSISVVMAAGLVVGAVASRFAPALLPSCGLEQRILAFQVVALGGLALVAVSVLGVKIVGYMLVSLAVGASNVASITYRQETIPVEFAGRVNSVIRMFVTGAIPLSGFIYAWSSRFHGYLFWVPELAVWALAVALWAWHSVRTERAARRSALCRTDFGGVVTDRPAPGGGVHDGDGGAGRPAGRSGELPGGRGPDLGTSRPGRRSGADH